MEIDSNGLKRKSLAFNSENLPPTTSGDDGRAPKLAVTPRNQSNDAGIRIAAQGNQTVDEELMAKSDWEIREFIARYKKFVQSVGGKLPDRVEQIKANIQRFECEFERRKKLQSEKADKGCEESKQLSDRPPELVVKSAHHITESQMTDVELVLKSDHEIVESIARFKETLQSLGDKMPDRGEKVKANVLKLEQELERRKKLLLEKADKGCEESKQLSDRPPELVMKSGNDITESQIKDVELVMKSDHEIVESLVRFRKTFQSLGDKMPDRGEKIKANVLKLEHELERRKKLQSVKADKGCEESIQFSGHPPELVVKSNDGIAECRMIDMELVMKSDHEIAECITRCRKTLQSLGDKLPDRGENFKANIVRHEHELERRKKLQPEKADKGCEESMQRSDHSVDGTSHGQKKSASKSQNGVAISSSTHDSLTDEKMQRIVNELVNLGISPSDVGKAAEICYRDSVKVKVLFALPSDMRRSYVVGFLYTQN